MILAWSRTTIFGKLTILQSYEGHFDIKAGKNKASVG